MASTAGLLVGVLNVSVREARSRVRHADLLGPRTSLTGQALAALLPMAAAARADGSISAQHASVIIDTITALPAAIPVEQRQRAEQVLVEHARQLEPRALASLARRLIDTLDQDGPAPVEDEPGRRRSLTLSPSRGGFTRLTADLDPDTAAMTAAVLHSLAAPRPAHADNDEPVSPDERSMPQRMHDALTSVMSRALHGSDLPASGGTPATVLITMTADQFETRTGLAATGYGQALTINQALRIADQASIAWIVHTSTGGILDYGHARRIATDKQILALTARDRGCSFPGCTIPAQWTQRHHIVAWADGGPTNLDNLASG